MSRSPTISTVYGTKRDLEARQRAQRRQFGEHGVEVTEFVHLARGKWRLRFRLTPEREQLRQINLKLKGRQEHADKTLQVLQAALAAGGLAQSARSLKQRAGTFRRLLDRIAGETS